MDKNVGKQKGGTQETTPSQKLQERKKERRDEKRKLLI